ncbi:MAG: lipopolysaccharide kinase InaA family protein [Gemmataceae bacterium]|nr:hypothetical protein [Gemmata sp.]MDW8197455.1 lipopolysaccharide kinase InaA family protein [Gemmataceae bacterium]
MRLDIVPPRERLPAVQPPSAPPCLPPDPDGVLTINPAFAQLLTQWGLTTATAFLQLSGEIVSGHPDRHVVRVEFPGTERVFYLKRQHIVGWREKLRNWWAGFGWVSRCQREGQLLEQLNALHLAAPRWVAYGAARGQAFLLLEEIPNAVELRQLLSTDRLTPAQQDRVAATLGQALAAVHGAGFSTPDLSAKHIWINPDTGAVTFLDWPSARRGRLRTAERLATLAAIHASLADGLAPPRQRLRMLRAYGEISDVARIEMLARRLGRRRSIRDQRLASTMTSPPAPTQRLVWLAGEAVCAIPEIAAGWPQPVIGPPFYGASAIAEERCLRWANREAVLVRGCSVAPWGRLWAWWRAVPWRSPGVTAARVLFHLERYGLAAPRLLAFGQRWVSRSRAEWFTLYEPVRGVPLGEAWTWATAKQRQRIRGRLVAYLQRLHDAGLVVVDPAQAFTVKDDDTIALARPLAVRIVRQVRATRRQRDLRMVFRWLGIV